MILCLFSSIYIRFSCFLFIRNSFSSYHKHDSLSIVYSLLLFFDHFYYFASWLMELSQAICQQHYIIAHGSIHHWFYTDCILCNLNVFGIVDFSKVCSCRVNYFFMMFLYPLFWVTVGHFMGCKSMDSPFNKLLFSKYILQSSKFPYYNLKAFDSRYTFNYYFYYCQRQILIPILES